MKQQLTVALATVVTLLVLVIIALAVVALVLYRKLRNKVQLLKTLFDKGVGRHKQGGMVTPASSIWLDM